MNSVTDAPDTLALRSAAAGYDCAATARALPAALA
jgi:hypothetical protein